MNKRQKLVQQAFLDDEEKVIRKLKNQYSHSLKEITKKSEKLQKDIERLDTLAKLSVDDEEKEKILSQRRSKVYQKQYQDSLKKQVSDILDKMQEEEFTTVAAYLDKCYEQGFVGTMYDLQGQGIPLCFPIDQEAMVRAVQLDSKISKGLYSRLGEDVNLLKKKITAQVSRGISTGMTYSQIAQQLAGYTNIGFNNAVRIARTEGHRIQVQAGMDACYKAKEKGADVVKQWDSTMDSATRESHVAVDGEIRELDEKFSNGLMFPGDPSGGAAEVVNCRCALLQRARWALKEKVNPDTGEVYWEDDSFTKMNNETKELVNFKDIDDYNEFKKTYLTKSSEISKIFTEIETDTSKALKNLNVDYNPVLAHTNTLTTDEIIQLVAGGDKTTGSCASVALAYAGQKQGWNVLDFRGGGSMDFFSYKHTKVKMFQDLGVKSIVADNAKSNLTNGKRILEQLNEGTEYYLSVGRHASIVRKKEGVLQYLELQCANPENNGWKNFGDVSNTLRYRFGCTSSSRYHSTAYATDISQLTGDDFRTILGYINTDVTSQRKGATGYAK